MKKIRLLALLLLLPLAARAQYQGCRQLFAGVNVQTACVQISSNNVFDPNGNKLAAGRFVLTVTNSSGTPISYTPQGGSSSSAQFIGQIVNGQVQNIAGFPFTIVNTLTMSPSGAFFDYKLQSTDGSITYQEYPLWTIQPNQSGAYSLDSYVALAGQVISGMGYPRTNGSPTAEYNQTDAPSGAKTWIMSNLFRTDRSNQWTQNPSSNIQCNNGQALVQPRLGPFYCILPENAFVLPGEGFFNPSTGPSPLSAGPVLAVPILPSGVPWTVNPGNHVTSATPAQIGGLFTNCDATDTILNSNGMCLPGSGAFSSFFNSAKVVGSSATTDLGAEINTAFTACSFNCEVDVRAGVYPWATTAVIKTNTQLLKGLGPKGAVYGNYSGSSDALLYQTNPFAALVNANSGGVENITIQGTSAGRSGIHTGNVIGGHLYNVSVTGFTGSTGKCIWVDNVKDSGNNPGWYERNVWLNVSLGSNVGLASQNCAFDMYVDNNGGTNSLGYNRILDLQMNTVPGSKGIYLDGSTGQVFWYNGTLNATCNVNSGHTQTLAIPECVTLTNNTDMKYNSVKLDGENNCLASDTCDATTGYGIHVLAGGQFQNAGTMTYQLWQLGVVNDNPTQINSLAIGNGQNWPYNYLVSADGDVVIASGPALSGNYWIYANGSNRDHSMMVNVGANRFDTGHYNISVPMQYAFNGQAVITNPRVVYDSNSLPQLVVTIGNRNSANIQMFAQYYGTQDHIPTILPGSSVGTTPATNTYSYMVDLFGNVVSNANYEGPRVAVTDCLQLASQGNCVVKSANVPITADGTVILATSAGNLTGRFVLAWSSPSRNHFVSLDVAATRFDSNYTMSKAVDYPYVGQPVLTGIQVVSDTNSEPQLIATIGNRNDGSNPDTLTVTWYGDGANVPAILPTGLTLGTTARTNRQAFGILTGLTGSIGGSSLAAGACATGGTLVPVLPAVVGEVATASPVTGVDPGGGMTVRANVTATNTVTVSVCAAIAGTPTASAYNVTVFQNQ